MLTDTVYDFGRNKSLNLKNKIKDAQRPYAHFNTNR